MSRNLITKCMFVLALLPFKKILAKDNTPVETFINHVRETNKFVEVSNLWVADNQFDRQDLYKSVEKAQPLTIDYARVDEFMKKKSMAISLVVPGIDGGTYTVDLARYNFMTSDFELHTLGDNGADGIVAYTPGLYYQGVVNGIPGSVAAFSFFNNEVYGIFSIPGEGNYTLVPNTMVGNYYDYNQHYLLYNDADLKITEHAPKCATEDMLPKEQRDAAAKTTTILNNKVYNSCTEVRVFEVGDYAMFLSKSKSVNNVANYLTALFNNQNVIYRNEGIPIVLKYLQVDSTKDNYQNIKTADSHLFLDTFGKVTKNVLHGCDLAILASTQYGTMGGVAWLQSMCSSYKSKSFFGPYGFVNIDNSAVVKFPTYSWNVEVISHEMGHMVGSPHTHSCCWGAGRNKAIDGCYTLEGSCSMPVPQYPTARGTIMSYCHLTSTGINLANGFGSDPGDTIRFFVNYMFSSTCGAVYAPTLTALSTANRTMTANRECTDMNTATTYYWYDNNTADHADDTLVLMVKKNGNNIGDLNTAGFNVTATTLLDYGTGKGVFTSFKPGTPTIGGYSVSMRRYWKVTTPKEPTSAVDVMFPFSYKDTSDISGSAVPATSVYSYKFYKTDASINPNPAVDSMRFASSGVSIYSNAGAASTTNWSLSSMSNYNVATMKVTSLSGGGAGFFTYGAVSVANIYAADASVYVYPNPAHDTWFISVAKNNGSEMSFRLYTVDGKMVKAQVLKSDAINTVSADNLATGMYFYRIVGEGKVYTGNVVKQ